MSFDIWDGFEEQKSIHKKKLISFEKQQPSHRRSNLFYSFQVRLHLCFVLYFFWCLWLYDSQISGHSNQIQNELDTVRLNHTECLSFNIHVPRTHTLTMVCIHKRMRKKTTWSKVSHWPLCVFFSSSLLFFRFFFLCLLRYVWVELKLCVGSSTYTGIWSLQDISVRSQRANEMDES